MPPWICRRRHLPPVGDVAGRAWGERTARADFVRSAGSLVSLIADHSLMWILVWWLIMTRKEATAIGPRCWLPQGYCCRS